MKKTLLTILTLALALSFCATWASSAAAESGALSGDARAAGYELLLPEGYEQYIELTAPTDLAIDGNYIAIADKPDASTAAVYLYSRADGMYRSYSFSAGGDVTSLNFYYGNGGDYLFFVLTGNIVRYIDLSSFSEAVTVQSFSPSVLQISGNEVYYAIQTGNGSNLYHTVIEESSENGITISPAEEPLTEAPLSTSIPAFASFDGSVYVSAGQSIYLCSPSAATEIYKTYDAVQYFAVAGGSNTDILYTNAGGLLYRGSAQSSLRGECAAVRYYDGYFYILEQSGGSAVGPREILRYSLTTEDFDSYRIGKYSDAENRLGTGASDLSVWGSTLLIADTANSRILSYDTGAGAFSSPVRVGYDPTLVCAGEDSFLASDGHSVYVYSYGSASPALTLSASAFSAGIRGFAYAYGNYYIVTDGNNNACVLSEEKALAGDASALREGSIALTGTSVAADLYGNVYVAAANSVYRFTEDSFGGGSAGDLACTFPETPLKILSDYEGNLYSLSETAVYRYTAGSESTVATYSFSDTFNDDSFLYSEDALPALSFAFGFESGTAYILSDGFIASAEGLNISALDSLSAQTAYEQIYGTLPDGSAASGALVRTSPQTVAVSLSLSDLEQEKPLLSCGSFRREGQERTGTVLAQTEHGVIALFYSEEVSGDFLVARSYEVCLLLEGSGYSVYDGTSQASYSNAVLSNEVGLYKYPAMRAEAPAGGNYDPDDYAFRRLATLSAGTNVQVLSLLSPGKGVLDSSSYAFVSYTDGEGAVHYGFIPESYLIPSSEAVLTGTTDFIWRNLARGASVTLTAEDGSSDTLTLSSQERVRVLGSADENGTVLISYTADGREYRARIDASLLEYHSSAIAVTTLVMVPLVTAAVLLSACYLIFRKQPTLQ